MEGKIERFYKAGKKDEEFLEAIKKADGDRPPGMFSDQLQKGLFAILYYGWRVARNGDNWDV